MMIPKDNEKQRSTSRTKTGIAPLWTKVMTESTFLEATTVVTQGARFTTTPYLPIHGAITGVKGFWWLSILLLMIVGLRLKIFHVKPLIDFHWKILFKWFTASFCGPHSWTLHVGLLPRRMEPGWSLAIIIIFCDADHESDHDMIMIMTIVTFPGGCCTSRETTGAGSFTGISQTTMGGFYLLHRPGFMKIWFLFMITIDTLTFMISWHHVSYIQHDYRQQHMSLISLRWKSCNMGPELCSDNFWA